MSTASQVVFPERSGLGSQMRRAAVSIPSNIAEGQGRFQGGSFLNHISIAHGSLREVECQAEIAQRLGYFQYAQFQHLTEKSSEVGWLLCGLYTALKGRR